MSRAILIAGPCAAESEEQVLRIAQPLSRHSRTTNVIFRAGVWKPRTSPDTFQGVGDVGLQWLQRVKQEYGLPVATEVSTPEQVRKALEAGIDYLWIGARTSANPILVQSIADALAGSQPKGVLVKNPVNEDAALWIGNIRRFQKSDVRCQIYAVHRGCSHKPCWEMAYRLRKELPEVPLLLDPSHMSGDARKVAELCRIGDELEYNGLMIEVHDKPEEALSDSKQQITPEELEKLDRRAVRSETATLLELRWLRRMMDEVDDALWETIARRMEVSKQIGEYKRQEGIAVVQPTRFAEILNKRLNWAKEKGLSEEVVREVMEAIHTESIKAQI